MLEAIKTVEKAMPDVKEIVEDENKIETVIAEDIEFRGRVVFKDSLKIKGYIEGKVETEGHFMIGQEATVSADIKAAVVSVNGSVNGKIKAHKRIDLFKKSKTMGDLVTPDLFIERGAVFNGTCIMNKGDKKS